MVLKKIINLPKLILFGTFLIVIFLVDLALDLRCNSNVFVKDNDNKPFLNLCVSG